MYQARLLNRHQIEDGRWDAFVDEHCDDIIYFHTWFLDGASDCWQAIIVEQNDLLVAIMPLQLKQWLGMYYSLQPLFCKYLGVVFCKEIAGTDSHHIQKKLLKLIIAALPRPLIYFNASFHAGFSNFLPFYWARFTVVPKMTYRLNLEGRQQFSTSITNHLRKAVGNYLQSNIQSDSATIIALAKERGLFNERSLLNFKHLWDQLSKRKNNLLLTVSDASGGIHSAAAFCTEGQKVFMLFSVVREPVKSQGANALLLTEAINHYRKCGKTWFYFEGSMFENVEAYLSGFRPEPILYFGISKGILPLTEQLFIPIYKKLQRIKAKIAGL